MHLGVQVDAITHSGADLQFVADAGQVTASIKRSFLGGYEMVNCLPVLYGQNILKTVS